MISIFKYPFEVQDDFIIAMPPTAQILTVQIQNGIPCIWAMVDTDMLVEERKFTIKGTGHSVSLEEQLKLKYIGTFQE